MQLFFAMILVFGGLLSSVNEHDIHVSVTDIELSADGKVEVVVKVFLDDLMHSMGLEMGAELPDNYTSSDDLVNKFLENSLKLKVNGETLKYVLEDTTPSSPALWITLTGETSDAIKTIEVDNTILIDLFDDQSNMINVSYKGKRYSELLDVDKTIYTVSVGK